MSPEELDEATVEEARRRWLSTPALRIHGTLGEDAPFIVARLARENWTPPKPVDQDVLAFREWFAQRAGSAPKSGILAGHWDSTSDADAFLAGARMATARERALRSVVDDYDWVRDGPGDRDWNVLDNTIIRARALLKEADQ